MDVPPGLVEEFDIERTLDEVTVNYVDPDATEDRFREWGWEGNAARGFSPAPDATIDPNGIRAVYASIHRFEDAAAAELAMYYSVDDQSQSTGATAVSVPWLGDSTRALVLVGPDGTALTIYVQEGT